MRESGSPIIGLLSPGAMGSAVGARLVEHGVQVLTSLAGRSENTVERARAAGMIDASLAEIAGADMILSIVPPAEADATARALAPHLATATHKPLYIDANALAPDTKRAVGAIISDAGAHFVDGSIIGGPPKKSGYLPVFYLAGPDAPRAARLNEMGLRCAVMAAPIGAAAALKMCYAGISKGLIGLGTAMLLAAARAGGADTLHAEMKQSMADLLDLFGVKVPQMYPKAYRWVAEMREIAAFLHEDPAAATVFEGFAQLYERIAADVAGEGTERAMLDAVLKRD